MRFLFFGTLFLFVLQACNESAPPTTEQSVIVQTVAAKEPEEESSPADSEQPKNELQQQTPATDNQNVKTKPQDKKVESAQRTVRQTTEKQEAPAVDEALRMSVEKSPEPVEEIAESKTHSEPSIEKGQKEKPVVASTAPDAPSHATWDALLNKYVSAGGKVNYAGLKNEMTKLDNYLKLLTSDPPQASWSKADKMAYWINAYNAFTVKLILDNYPLSSITKLDDGNPWKVRWINIGNKTYSLDEIENSILRPQFKDARIHFAVNCAAKSCPPLLNQAWTAGNLEANFERQTRAFINNPAFNKISAKEMQVSKIFEWYAEDFGDLVTFLNRYSSVKISTTARISYLEYDWSLNN